ncbi:hypothetical protein [Abyssisolibacter fermentans]|uniref:hypothetical protein n=1 Tax=Abyssisolibacter fermentans TaxID=1766203 RepID=UPI00082A0B2B|nr:hypothetical protein [Abyssisolibacter fermentans]
MDKRKFKIINIVTYVVIFLILIFNIWLTFFSGAMESPDSSNIRIFIYSVYGILFVLVINFILRKVLKNLINKYSKG